LAPIERRRDSAGRQAQNIRRERFVIVSLAFPLTARRRTPRGRISLTTASG